VLPALSLLPHTSRAALSDVEGASGSLHPWRLIEIVWPRAFGDPVDPALNHAQLIAVVFSYRTPLLVEGAVLSLGGWLALIALVWARRTSLPQWK
jgi:hypothetical protein